MRRIVGIKRANEERFQAAVIALARAYNWKCYHTRDSRKSAKGFPDLAFRRGPKYKLRVVFAELKMPGKVPTPEQVEWLQALASVPDLHVYRWCPDDFDEIREVLSRA